MFKIRKNILLAPYTNYKIGGPARYFCEINNREEIIEALNFAHKENVPVFILGEGTNILVSDKGFYGLVIKLQGFEKIQIANNKLQIRTPQWNRGNLVGTLKPKYQISNNKQIQDSKIIVGAGSLLGDIVNFALKNELQGLEWASGIPGTVGGAIRGNAGAFGSCMANIVESIEMIEMKKKNLPDTCREEPWQKNDNGYKIKILNNKQLKFKYRTSIVKEREGMIILSATFKLKRIANYEL